MSSTLENAPLVELIAELRWDSQAALRAPVAGGAGHAFMANSAGALDGFFMRFGGAVSILGYSESERLVPVQFPTFAHQPIYRFKQKGDGETRSLYQVGGGIFSANAVPPYRSWSTFEPVVRKGVDALLKSRNDNEATSPFTAISLRYIDAFGPDLTGDRSVNEFFSQVLGVSIGVPEALAQHLRTEASITPVLQLQIPMKDSMVMSVSLGEGVANGKKAIMMDTSVATTLAVPADIDEVVNVFNIAHEAIARSFLQLTRPIAHLMSSTDNGAT